MGMPKRNFISNFIQLMTTVFLMFFFAATLGESTAKTILIMNDKSIEKSIIEQIIFWSGAFVFTGVWSLIWMWFKKSEKVCIEYLSKETSKSN